jgi:hypothetical protein
MQKHNSDSGEPVIPDAVRNAIEKYVSAGHRDEVVFDVGEALRGFSERGDRAGFKAYANEVIVSLSTDRDGLDLF